SSGRVRLGARKRAWCGLLWSSSLRARLSAQRGRPRAPKARLQARSLGSPLPPLPYQEPQRRLPYHRIDNEEKVRRPLGHAPHEVRIPSLAEGNVDAQVPAVVDDLLLEVAADAVEHLELEVAGGDPLGAGEVDGGAEHPLVVGREPRVFAGLPAH